MDIEIKLEKPMKIKGKETKVIHLDLEKLTGNDLVQAEREARAMGVAEGSVLASMKYQAIICAKAIGCTVDDLLGINAADFKNIVRQAAAFLLG